MASQKSHTQERERGGVARDPIKRKKKNKGVRRIKERRAKDAYKEASRETPGEFGVDFEAGEGGREMVEWMTEVVTKPEGGEGGGEVVNREVELAA